MTMDLLCALLLFVGNVGHLGVLSYKVLKFSELEVGLNPPPPSFTVRTRPGVQCAVASGQIGGGAPYATAAPTLSDSGLWLRALHPPLTPYSCPDISAAADAASPRAGGLPQPDRFREDHELAGAI
jgi:hypothetical protein